MESIHFANLKILYIAIIFDVCSIFVICDLKEAVTFTSCILSSGLSELTSWKPSICIIRTFISNICYLLLAVRTLYSIFCCWRELKSFPLWYPMKPMLTQFYTIYLGYMFFASPKHSLFPDLMQSFRVLHFFCRRYTNIFHIFASFLPTCSKLPEGSGF